MKIYQLARGHLINLDQITDIEIKAGATIQESVAHIHFSGRPEPLLMSDSKEIDKLIARLEKLSL